MTPNCRYDIQISLRGQNMSPSEPSGIGLISDTNTPVEICV